MRTSRTKFLVGDTCVKPAKEQSFNDEFAIEVVIGAFESGVVGHTQ